MRSTEVERAVTAARAVSSSLGLAADEAVVLNNSNKLTLRLLPADVVAQVSPAAGRDAEFEVEVARRLAELGCPVGAPDPRTGSALHHRDDFVITFWTHHASRPGEIDPDDYARALVQLHAGLRMIEIDAPRAADRVASAREIVGRPELNPELPDDERVLLLDTLDRLGRSVADHDHEQLLHGEPHPGNVLHTARGPVIIDFETVCRGPVEFDLAHAPVEVAARYPGVDHDLVQDCRTLMLAMIISWRWDPDDQLPDGRRLAAEWTAQLRQTVESGPGRAG